MKPTLPTPPSLPTKTTKPDPFKRLSLAVKKLDQLIDRAHQLGTFTEQLLRDDLTGSSLPLSKTDPVLPTIPGFTSTDKKPNEQVDTPEKLEGAGKEKNRAGDE